MNTRPLLFLCFCCICWLFPQLTNAQNEDDCHLNDAASAAKAYQQMLMDSMDLADFVPAPSKLTEACAIPSTVSHNAILKAQPDRIYGFFAGVENANKYLIVITENGLENIAPENGRFYKPGSMLGQGRVVAYDAATAFVALSLNPLSTYGIVIYSANENCAEGVKYNATPIFSSVMKTTGTPTYNYYYGNLHSHSSYSDGNQDNTNFIPSDDYAYARDAQCMDFLGISEHNHYSYPHNPGMHVADYQNGLQQAQQFTNNNPGFLALYGMEFGVIDNGGHMVIYGIDSLFGWETLVGSPNYNIFVGKYDYTGVNGLFNTVNRFRSKNAFAYCAHPNDNDYGNLLGIAYQPFVDSALIGSALENGPAFSDETNYHDYPNTMSYLQYYKKLLAKGYHVGPTMDHDNHNYTFGRTSRSRLVVLSPSLGKEDFMNAMRSRNFYATHSCTATLDFQLDGAMMGSELQHSGAPSMVITMADPSSNQQPQIRIYKGTDNGSQAAIVASGSSSPFTYTDDNLVDGASAYYFTDISMGNMRTISAPIWYHRNDGGGATSISNNIPGTENAALVILSNPVTEGFLSYTLSGANGKQVIEVSDMNGKILLTKTFMNGTGVKHVNIAALPAGIYVLKISTDAATYSKKFVKL